MKQCPNCKKTYTEESLSFCIEDGTPLIPVSSPAEESRTAAPEPASTGEAPAGSRDWQAPVYRPPGYNAPPGTGTKRKFWPWVVGILAVVLLGIIGLSIAAAIVIPSLLRAAANKNSTNFNAPADRDRNQNSESNSNSGNFNSSDVNENLNINAKKEEDSTAAPTDEEKVLPELRDLENEWTLANINADKKALDRILADDYVGTSSDGKRQGKAEYINTIVRDTVTEKWEFNELQVTLNGDRATLTGVVRFTVRQQDLPYRFTDKFVWRDGRWQATGSEVSQIK